MRASHRQQAGISCQHCIILLLNIAQLIYQFHIWNFGAFQRYQDCLFPLVKRCSHRSQMWQTDRRTDIQNCRSIVDKPNCQRTTSGHPKNHSASYNYHIHKPQQITVRDKFTKHGHFAVSALQA